VIELLLLLLYYCVYIVAGSVYCPLFADDIYPVAFSVWLLMLKETLPLSSGAVSIILLLSSLHGVVLNS